MTLYALQTRPTGPLLWPWKAFPGASPAGSHPCPHIPPTTATPAPTCTYPLVCNKGLLFFCYTFGSFVSCLELNLMTDSQGSLPLIWLLGILPPPESFFLWLAEQVATLNYSSFCLVFGLWFEQLYYRFFGFCTALY